MSADLGKGSHAAPARLDNQVRRQLGEDSQVVYRDETPADLVVYPG